MSTLLTVLCALSVVITLWADYKHRLSIKRIAKTAAAACFVLVAVSLGATSNGIGRWLVAGLILGGLGDIALLGNGKKALALGMGLFAAGHAMYLIAIAQIVPPQDWISAAILGPFVIGFAALVWLWPHLGSFRIPVTVYMLLFATTAVAAWAPAMKLDPAPVQAWLLAIGVSSFFASDLAVARHRFVTSSFINRLWGLPAYFTGQLLIAWSAG